MLIKQSLLYLIYNRFHFNAINFWSTRLFYNYYKSWKKS